MERLDVYPLVDPHVRNSWKMVISYELPFFDDNCSIECSPSNDVLGVIRKKKKKKNAEKLKIPHYFFHIYISEKACIHFISVYSLSIQLVFPYICSFVSLPPFVVVLDLSLSILLPHSASVWYVFCAWDFNSYIDEYLLLFLIKLRPPPFLN